MYTTDTYIHISKVAKLVEETNRIAEQLKEEIFQHEEEKLQHNITKDKLHELEKEVAFLREHLMLTLNES